MPSTWRSGRDDARIGEPLENPGRYNQVRNKAAHIAVGIDLDGVKHVLRIWVQTSEGAKFWAGVLAELRNRGITDTLIVCCDGLTGFPEAIEATWPRAIVQTCTNPRTGRSHLPDSRQTDAARIRGRGAYQVEGILVDADLFRRLRVRAEARGPEGLDDLKRALTLVTGTPFGQLRRDGGAWLADTGRLDQVLQCAIIDVAHLVTTACLAEGDLNGAHAAAELAAKVAPSEETAQLDLIAVLAAQGHRQVAEHMLRDRVCNRSDDEDEIPTELPARTEAIIDNHAWLAPRNAQASA